jgi:hypothetical protein
MSGVLGAIIHSERFMRVALRSGCSRWITRESSRGAVVTPRAARMTAPDVTIADLGDFAADAYASRLDAWCGAPLRSWGAQPEQR